MNNKIKELIASRGMTVADVSILTGISVGALYSLTNLRTAPKGKYLSAIEYALRLQSGAIEEAYYASKQAKVDELEAKRANL